MIFKECVPFLIEEISGAFVYHIAKDAYVVKINIPCSGICSDSVSKIVAEAIDVFILKVVQMQKTHKESNGPHG